MRFKGMEISTINHIQLQLINYSLRALNSK